MNYIISPLMQIPTLLSKRLASKPLFIKISEIIQSECDNEQNEIIENINEITISKLGFMYDEKVVLDDISYKFERNKSYAIVGPSGSGKTTLVNSLLRLYNVEENSILIDGVDIMKCDIPSVRDAISYVPQDNFLFSDKVRNNIAFSNAELEFEKIEMAARFADVHDNILGFTEGYDTISGERGVTLSGGQKQRLSIARAYVKDAPIMIMDDSVSAVDVKTEETILHNIHKHRSGKTTIVIASRVSTVSNMDKIIVLNEGKLEAFDTHENLLETSSLYREMVELQRLEDEKEAM
jgi:ATP-binding cassette subfamily B protein